MSKLQEKRNASGLSQGDLSKTTGISVRTLQAYENGARDINKCQAINLYKLAEALGCSMEELLET